MLLTKLKTMVTVLVVVTVLGSGVEEHWATWRRSGKSGGNKTGRSKVK